MNRFSLSLFGIVALLTASCAAQQIPIPFFHAVDTATAVKTLPNFSPDVGYNLLRVKDSTMMFYQYSWHEYITKAAGAKGHVWIRNVGPGIFNIGPQDTLFIKGSGVTFTKTGTDTLLMTVAAGSGDITDVGPMYASGAAGTDGVTTSGTTLFSIEGVTNNAFETNLILASADPGADINLTFPNATSTIVGHTSSVLDVAGLGLSVSSTTLIFDATELGNLTFGPGTDGSVVYNWNLTAGDPQLTLGNGVFNISSGTLQQGGTAVVLQSRTVSTTSPLTGGGALSGDLTLSITANGIGPTQIDETANYTWTGKHDYTGAEILGASALPFEGATDDNIYTIFAFTDPTSSSKTITFPNASGTVAVSATSPVTLSAGGAIGLTQNAGTDVTADLEEETHVSEHQDGGADELSVTGLSGLLADVQKVGVRKNSTGTVFTRQQINLIEGTNITLTVADDAGTPELDVTIAASGTGEANTASNLGGGLANYDSKSSVDLRFNSFASADFDLASNLLTIDDTKWAKDSELHAAVTLAGENYLSLSTQQITANAVNLSGTHVTGTLAAARFGALTGDVTNSAGSYATTIANDVVTFAKFQNITDARLLGRSAGSSGDMQEITVGSGLSLSGGSLTASGSALSSEAFVTIGNTSGLSAERALTGTANEITVSDGGANGAVTLSLPTNLTLAGKNLQTGILFVGEGATDDNNETIFAIIDPTADRTIAFPNADGTIAVSATSPLSISASGNVSLGTASNGQLLIGNGSGYTLATPTAGNYMDISTGAGSLTFDMDPTEVGSVTWLDNADRNWTFDIASSGTNPVISFSNNTINISTGVLQVGSTNVALSSEVFVTVSNTSGLSNERALSASNYIDLTDAGANSILAISMDPTEVGSVTWGTADATWTFDATSGTNPTLEWSDLALTITGNLNLKYPSGLGSSRLRFFEDAASGTDFVYIEAPSSVTTTYLLVLPSSQASGIKPLKNNGSGSLSWSEINLGSSSEVTGVLPVNNGGTGVTSSTGTGSNVLSTSPTITTPTISGDLNAVVIEGANSKTLTESSATSFVRVDVSAGSFVGGTIFYTVYANDGTNYQARSGSINFSIVSESADTETAGIGTVSSEAIAASAGTLTVAFTTDDSPTDGINFQANAVSSLSQTTLQIKYRVVISSGTATVTGL